MHVLYQHWVCVGCQAVDIVVKLKYLILLVDLVARQWRASDTIPSTSGPVRPVIVGHQTPTTVAHALAVGCQATERLRRQHRNVWIRYAAAAALRCVSDDVARVFVYVLPW